MKEAIALRKPTGTPVVNDCSTTNIGAGAYVQLSASLTAPASAMQIYNGSAQPLKFAVGAAAAEKDIGYVVAPSSVSPIIPVELKNAQRLTARSVGGTANTGILVVNFLS